MYVQRFVDLGRWVGGRVGDGGGGGAGERGGVWHSVVGGAVDSAGRVGGRDWVGVRALLSPAAIGLVVLLGAIGASAGCATSVNLRAAIASEETSKAALRLQARINDLHKRYGADGRLIVSDGDHEAWRRAFERLGGIGLLVDEAVRQGNGAGAAVQIRAALDLLDELQARDVLRIPAEYQLGVLLLLEGVRATLIAVSVGASSAWWPEPWDPG